MTSYPLVAARFLLGLPIEPLDCPLDRMLDLAQATPLCAVAVAGPEAADLMCALSRRGYQKVEAARRATCPGADELCDLLFVAGCASAQNAAETIHAVRSMLRPDGLAIIDAGRMTSADERLRLCGLLAEDGFACQPDAHLAAEIMARRLPVLRWKSAA